MGINIRKKNNNSSNGKLGLPSDKNWSDGFFNSWSKNTTIKDAIDDINEGLIVFNNKDLLLQTTINNGIDLLQQKDVLLETTITDSVTALQQKDTLLETTLNDGLGSLQQKDISHDNSISEINALLADLMPAKAGTLTNTSLTSNAVVYTGKLADGLTPDWYITKNAGNTINTYMISNSFVLSTIASIFRCGKKLKPETYGVLELLKNAITVNSYDMTQGIGSLNGLSVTAIDVYNSIWSKASANVTINLDTDGYNKYELKHSEAGISNPTEVWYDSTPGNLTFKTSPTNTIETEVIKWLSGIQYLTTGTTIKVQYEADEGIFKSVYHATSVSDISNIAFNTTIVNPTTVPNYNDVFLVDKVVTLSIANKADNNSVITVKLYKPNRNITATTHIVKRICTYGTVSTLTTEDFYDETKRLVLDTNDLWDSELALDNSDAQVKNGVLEYGNTDYNTKSGVQEYQRKFTKVSASTGSLTFNNLPYTNISSYGTGSINVLIKLDTDNLYYDLGRVVGDKNGTGSGDSRINSIGARVNGTGNLINWSLGTKSTAYNNSEYRVIIIFRDNTKTITKIISA